MGAVLNLSSNLKKMASLREQLDNLKFEQTKIQEEYRALQIEVQQAMQANDLQNVKIESEPGKTFTAYMFNGINAKVEDEEAFNQWCKEQGMESSEQYKMWSSAKIKKTVREIQDIDDEPLPSGVEVREFSEVRLRRD